MTQISANGDASADDEALLVFRETRLIPASTSKTGPPRDGKEFEYAEHSFLGDSVQLKLEGGNATAAALIPLALPNKLQLTYGQINGLAGDFYGTTKPISDGADDEDRAHRFILAYNQLAVDTNRQPSEATAILDLLQEEVEAVNTALKDGKDPSEALSKLKGINFKLQKITITRGKDYPSYLMLAQRNWDHFGEDARTAYNTGHAEALKYAGTPGSDLRLAYAMNAFADHFLEDSFSAGHLRAPRRALHDSINFTADWCCKYMHDEDCALGIAVKNPSGDSFMVYGDKRLLDKANSQNQQVCLSAVQASADEVYQAWCDKKTPSESSYKAWSYAPTLESSRGDQVLAPLFKFPENRSSVAPRRKDITKRRMGKDTDYTDDYWWATTLGELNLSKLWDYPMYLDN